MPEQSQSLHRSGWNFVEKEAQQTINELLEQGLGGFRAYGFRDLRFRVWVSPKHCALGFPGITIYKKDRRYILYTWIPKVIVSKPLWGPSIGYTPIWTLWVCWSSGIPNPKAKTFFWKNRSTRATRKRQPTP